jgi:hypothetical protein
MRRAAALAVLVLLAGACAPTPTSNHVVNAPSNQPVFLRASDTHFRLSQDQRAAVHPSYNADAVERLLSWIRPEIRIEVLETFSRSSVAELGEKVALGEPTWEVEHPQIREIVKGLRATTRPPAGSAEQTEP